MRGTGIIATPYLQDILLRKTHVLVHHELGLHTHVQRHQDKEERQHELKTYQDIAQRLSLHTHRVRTLQYKRGGLSCGIERRSNSGNHGREQCNAKHQDQDANIILQRNAV